MAHREKKVYDGVYAAMSTALTADREVDRQGIANIVNHMLDAGIDGLSILGTTGECNGLRHEQRIAVLDATLEANNGRGTVFTGAAGTIASQILADLKAMDKPGVSGALVPPPFYYPLDTRGVVEFYEHIAEESPIPIILYNIPQVTKIRLSNAAVERLSGHPNIIGIKDSSGDYAGFTHYARIAKAHPGFTLLTGADNTLFGCLMIGGNGIIGGTVNAAPALEAQIFKAFKDGRHDEAQLLQQKLTQVVDVCKIGPGPAGYKASHVLRGLCGPYMTHPLQWLTDEEMDQQRTKLEQLGVLEPIRA